MAKTPYYTKAEAEAKNAEAVREIKQNILAIGAGEGGKMYDSLAEAQALTEKPVDGTIFTVSELMDPANAGVYTFQSGETGGVRFERENFKIEEIANIYPSKNLFKTSNVVDGKYIGTTSGNTLRDGEIHPASGWGHSGFIPITPGMTYSLSGERGRVGLCFYTSESDTANIPESYNTGAAPLTVTAPPNANFVVFNLYSSSSPSYSNIQFEEGSVVTSYEPYGAIYKIKENALPVVNRVGFEVSLYEAEGYENYILTSLGGKELKQEIRPFDPIYPFGILNVYYDGSFLKGGGDEVAPYRIDGGTIGANHNPSTHIKNRKITFFIDNTEVPSNSKYYPEKHFTVKEYYDIEGKNTAGIVAKVSISYEFNRFGGCTIYTDILGVQNIALADIMFLQAAAMGGTCSYYVPKSLPFTQDGVDYDFSSLYDMSGFSPINPFFFTTDRCEATGILSDRLIMRKDSMGFALGYLPIQDAGVARRREVAIEKALEIRNDTKKVYMSAIDPSGTGALNAGEFYSVVAYRTYFTPQSNATSSYIIPSNIGTYLYLDWHQTTTDRMELPNELSGKPYEVIEKSDSVTILSKENTGSMLFDVNMKGYVILRF